MYAILLKYISTRFPLIFNAFLLLIHSSPSCVQFSFSFTVFIPLFSQISKTYSFLLHCPVIFALFFELYLNLHVYVFFISFVK